MTFGTYCAIQNVLDNKNSEKYPDIVFLDKEKFKKINNDEFKILCELYYNNFDNHFFNFGEMVNLGFDPKSIKGLEDKDLIQFYENGSFIFASIGEKFMGYLEKEVKNYLGRNLIDYKYN